MSIRSTLNRRRLLRDFSSLPVKTPARTRAAYLLREIGAKIPRRKLDLSSLRNVNLAFILRIPGLRLPKSKRAPKRCIGIDIGRLHVRAVQIARTPDGLCIEKAFGTQARRSTDSPADILRSLTEKHGFDPRADVAVALPHQSFYFADVETGPAEIQRLRAADAAALKDCFPIPADDAVVQVCSVLPGRAGKHLLLVAAASCTMLREQLSLLGEAKIRPARIDTPTTAAHAAVMANHPEAANGLALVLYVDESTLSLAVTQNGSLLLVRNLPMFAGETQDAQELARQTAEVVAQEIAITWRRLFGKDPDAGLRIFLIASRQMAESLAPAVGEKTGSQIVLVDPYATVSPAEPIETDFSPCVAAGLALRTLQPPVANQVDFLAAYRVRTQPPVRTKRELAVCGGLAAAVAAVWVAGVLLQLSSLESRFASLREQEIAILQRVAPDEKTIVNPAAQLQQRLEALRKDAAMFTGFNPGQPTTMEVLSTLSRQMPAKGGVQLRDVLIAGDSVRITGTCDSFNTFYDWQRLLEKTPGLRLTDSPPPRKEDGKSERVEFQVSMSTTENQPS